MQDPIAVQAALKRLCRTHRLLTEDEATRLCELFGFDPDVTLG